MKNIFILLILFASCLLAEIDERKSDIYYGNGILTTKKEARDSLKRVLKPAVLNEIYNGNQVKMDELHHFDLAYNYSAKENFGDTAIASILDLMESYQQLGNTSMGWGIAQAMLDLVRSRTNIFSTWAELRFVTYFKNRGISDVVSSFLSKQVVGVSRETLIQVASDLWNYNPSAIHDRDLKEMVAKYSQSINDGHGVILVTHSQGNLFALEAVNRVNFSMGIQAFKPWMRKYVHHVSIASPATKFASDSHWLTSLDNDVVARIPGSVGFSHINPVRYFTHKTVSIQPAMSPDATYEWTNNPPIDASSPDGYWLKGVTPPSFTKVVRAESGFNAGVLQDFTMDVVPDEWSYWATEFHAFKYYMGVTSFEANIGSGGTRSITSQETKKNIVNSIKYAIESHKNSPSQWEKYKEKGCGCDKKIRLKHKEQFGGIYRLLKDVDVMEFNEGGGKVYPIDGEYVKANINGIAIQDQTAEIETNGGICYVLDGTAETITGALAPNPVKGTIEAVLEWRSKEINLDLSVQYKDVDGLNPQEDVGKVDLESMAIECSNEHWYINNAQIKEGDYTLSIKREDTAEVNEALLPQNVRFEVKAPNTVVSFSLDVSSGDDLNMGEVAVVHVTKNENTSLGTSVSLSQRVLGNPSIATQVSRIASNGTAHNYQALSLLPTAECGALADASYSVSPLLEPERILYTGFTSSSSEMQNNGLMLLPSSLKDVVNDDALYLLSVDGGRDVDANDDLILDPIATTNLGSIHSLVYGSEIKAGKIKTNILTEMSYQIFSHSNETNLTKIEMTLTQVAQKLLREDINKDAKIDYADLHAWVPSFDKSKLLMSYEDKLEPIVQKVYKNEDIYLDVYSLLYAGGMLDGLEIDNSSSSDAIRLSFNSLVDTSVLRADSFIVTDSQGNSVDVVTTIKDGEVMLSFNEKLSIGATYTLTYSLVVQDTLGNTYMDNYVHEVLIPDIQAPEILSLGSIEVDENKRSVATIIAQDDSQSTLTYSVTGGLDADLFEFGNTDKLLFLDAANYEKPLDADKDNIYEVEITVKDAALNASSLSLQVRVNNLVEVPEIESVSFEINEGVPIGTYIGSITIINEGDAQLESFENKNSKDFEIDDEGKVYTKLALDFEKQAKYNFSTKMYTTQGLSNSARVEVNIMDVEEFLPQINNFTGSMHSFAKEGTLLGKLYVYEGQDVVSKIELSGEGASDFKVDVNGSIRVSSVNLDETIKKLYNLKALGTNSYGLSEEANVSIYINSFVHQYGTDKNDVIEDIIVDSSGNIYVTGTTSGLLDGNASDAYNDAFVSKFSQDSKLLWTKQFGKEYATRSMSIVLDSQENIYIAGDQKTDKVGAYYRTAVWITAISSDGNLLWSKNLDSGIDSYEEAISILVDNNNYLYVVGNTSGSFEGTTNKGYDDVFISKLDTEGTTQWTKLFGTVSSENMTSAMMSNDEHIIITGSSKGEFSGAVQEGLKGVFIMDVSSVGEVSWIRQFGENTADWIEVSSISLDENNNLYTVGYYYTYGNDKYYQFVDKYDRSGIRLWRDISEYSSYVFPKDIVVSSNGAFLTGYTYGSMDGNINKTDYLATYERADMYLMKYDFDGNKIYTKQFGSNDWDESHAITKDTNSYLYLGGYVSESFEGFTALGGDDALLMKIAQ